MKKPRKSGEALTREEAIALEEELGRPITWPARHHHSSDQGLLRQKSSIDGTNQVPAHGSNPE